MEHLTIEARFLTDVGRKRPHNEDYVDHFVPDDADELGRSGRIYIVADGVGGAAAGEVASEYATKKVLHEYFQSQGNDLGKRLRDAIRVANRDLHQRAQDRPEVGRMGTTLVAAVIHGDSLIIGSVGDSRAYLIRNGEIRQITRDHTLVAKLVEEGSITPEEAVEHPRRNVVLRSVGVDPEVHPDIFEAQLHPGDQVLLCSDGLTRHVGDHELAETAADRSAGRAVRRLVDLANARGGKDNISAMLLRAHPPGFTLADDEDTVATRMPTGAAAVGLDDTDPPQRKRRQKTRSREWLLLVPLAVLALAAVVLLGVLIVRLVRSDGDVATSPLSTLTGPTPSISGESLRSPEAEMHVTPADQIIASAAPDDVIPTTIELPSPVPTTTAGIDTDVPPTLAVPLTRADSSAEPELFFWMPMTYTVSAGDNLWDITARWGASRRLESGAGALDCIAAANNLPTPNEAQVDVGQLLEIPGRCMDEQGIVGILVFMSQIDAESQRTARINIEADPAEPVEFIQGLGAIDRTEALSPDGAWNAFVMSGTDIYGELWLRSGDGREVLVVHGECAAFPIWSPNSRYLAFTSPCEFQSDGTWKTRGDGDPGDIWVAPRDFATRGTPHPYFMRLLAGPGMEVIHDWYLNE